MKPYLTSLFLTLFLITSLQPAFAANDGFGYPELMVAPRASQRLLMEANNESKNKWKNFGAIGISGLATLISGVLQFSDVDKADDTEERSPLVGVVVGGGWVAASFLLSNMYRPYARGYESIKPLHKKTKRQVLVRERMAEEAIRDAASLGKKLRWMSAITNFGASAFMLSKVESDSLGQVANGLSMLLAFAPVFFKPHWEKVDKEHSLYKKKIYGPITWNTLMFEPIHKRIVPGVSMAFTF